MLRRWLASPYSLVSIQYTIIDMIRIHSQPQLPVTRQPYSIALIFPTVFPQCNLHTPIPNPHHYSLYSLPFVASTSLFFAPSLGFSPTLTISPVRIPCSGNSPLVPRNHSGITDVVTVRMLETVRLSGRPRAQELRGAWRRGGGVLGSFSGEFEGEEGHVSCEESLWDSFGLCFGEVEGMLEG